MENDYYVPRFTPAETLERYNLGFPSIPGDPNCLYDWDEDSVASTVFDDSTNLDDLDYFPDSP